MRCSVQFEARGGGGGVIKTKLWKISSYKIFTFIFISNVHTVSFDLKEVLLG